MIKRLVLLLCLAPALSGCGALLGYCVTEKQNNKTPLVCDW